MITIIGKGRDSRNLAALLNCKRFDKNADTIIRYGNIRQGFNGIVINSIESINNARDKLYTLTILSENGIKVPEFGIEFENITKPFFARERFHKKGRDILIYKDNDVVPIETLKNTKHYWIKYIPTDREYRIHVMGDEVIQICKKIPNDNTHENDMIRNLESGWHLAEARNWQEGYNKLKEIAIASVKYLGLDFGAVDVILGKDKQYYVLEVNTAPGLDNKRLDLYVENFIKLVTLKQAPPNKRIMAKVVFPQWYIDFINRIRHYGIPNTKDVYEWNFKFIEQYFEEAKNANAIQQGNTGNV
jgi:glutathione synthase/RimK-type ligase-like ATP-grasp enzyme